MPTTAGPGRLLPLTLAVLCAVTLVPIILVRHPPLPDLSQHLAAVSVLHNLGDPRYDLDRYYQASAGLSPYWGYYGPVHLLAYLFGVEVAGRLLLALYACALPLGTALLARRLGRSPWLALFAFPVVWNYNFVVGFIAFCVGLALLPFALAAFDAFCERPSAGRGLLAALLGVAMYFTHLLPWGAWLGCAGLIGLLHRGQSLRSLAARLAAWLPSLLVGVWVTLHGQGLNMGRVANGLQWKRYPITFDWPYLKDLIQFGWWPCVGREWEILLGVLGAAWLALRVTARRRRFELHDLRAEACFAVALGAYLVLPRSITAPAYWWGVNIRFACITFLFLGLTIPGDIDVTRGVRRWLLAPAALAVVGFAADITAHWVTAQRFCAGYDALANTPERGSRVLFVLGYPWYDHHARFNYLPGSGLDHYVHTYYGYYQAEHGGFMPWNFDEGFPLKYKVRYPASSWREQRFDWNTQSPYYDYVFAFHHDSGDVFGPHLAEVKKVGQSGHWSLWKLPGPRRDDSPWKAYPSPYL